MSLKALKEGVLARNIYLLAAGGTSLLYAFSGKLQSVGARRSVGTGEIHFGRSDIDLELLLRPYCCDGLSLNRLYLFHRIIAALNPALGHVWVLEPGDFKTIAAWNTVRGYMEQTSYRHLWGSRRRAGELTIRPDDALREFLLWFDLYLPAAVQRRDGRNCKKHALECWNFYSVAEELLRWPHLTRASMEQHLLRSRELPTDVNTPVGLMRFCLELAADLHSRRMEKLPRLRDTLIFQGCGAPHGITRTYVVLPSPESPLPKEAFNPGSFIATPELLDLYLQYKNGFFHWLAPEQLCLKPPTVKGFLRDVRHFCSPHFLRFPGFVEGRFALDPEVKMEYLTHAYDALHKGLLPTAPSAVRSQKGISDVERYYRSSYDGLKQRTERLVKQVNLLLEDDRCLA